MTATIHTLNIQQKHPQEARQEGIVQHTCGSTLFRISAMDSVYCNKCSEMLESLEVCDRVSAEGSAA